MSILTLRAVEAARIEAALRRRAAPVPFVLGDLAIDYDRLCSAQSRSSVDLHGLDLP